MDRPEATAWSPSGEIGDGDVGLVVGVRSDGEYPGTWWGRPSQSVVCQTPQVAHLSRRRRQKTIACATQQQSRNRASALPAAGCQPALQAGYQPDAGDGQRSPAPLRRERILPSSEEMKVL